MQDEEGLLGKGTHPQHTLKSYTITPIESANVLEVTMKFCGGYKYKSPSKRRWDRLRKEIFLATFKRDPLLVTVPFLEPGQSPIPVALGGPVYSAITTAFMTQAEEMWGTCKICVISGTAWYRIPARLRRSRRRCVGKCRT